MRKILLTGFEPFNGRDINPSQLVVEKIIEPENCILVKRILPVEYATTTRLLTELVEAEKPDILLSLGQAGNVPNIAIERVAINMDNGRASDGSSVLPDSSGDAAVDRPILANGESAYFSNLPIWELVREVNAKDVACRASYSAGTFVCNHVMYIGAYLASQHADMRSGFVHVPFLPQQLEADANKSGRYAMELADMVTGVQAIVDYLARN